MSDGLLYLNGEPHAIVDKRIIEAIEDLRQQRDALLQALQPLAKISLWRDQYPDAKKDHLTGENHRLAWAITVEDVCKARAAIELVEGKSGSETTATSIKGDGNAPAS
jgi:hypothetical protein